MYLPVYPDGAVTTTKSWFGIAQPPFAVIAIRFHPMKESNVMDRRLEGVRVVELAMWVAGASSSAVLGDWGADVIKLEDPKTGDPIRGFVTRTMGDPNARIRRPFGLDKRNKRSVAVDLRRAE